MPTPDMPTVIAKRRLQDGSAPFILTRDEAYLDLRDRTQTLGTIEQTQLLLHYVMELVELGDRTTIRYKLKWESN